MLEVFRERGDYGGVDMEIWSSGTALLLFGFRCWRKGRLGVVMERMVGPRVLYRVVAVRGRLIWGGSMAAAGL